MISHTLAQWLAIAHELTAHHQPTTPAGLSERVADLIAGAPPGWPEQRYELDLDKASTETIRAIQASLDGGGLVTGQQAASVTEAMAIIQRHQQKHR